MTDQIQEIQGHEIDFDMTDEAQNGLTGLLDFIVEVTEEDGSIPMTVISNTHDGAIVLISTEDNNVMGEVFADGRMRICHIADGANIVEILTNEFANRLNSMIRASN